MTSNNWKGLRLPLSYLGRAKPMASLFVFLLLSFSSAKLGLTQAPFYQGKNLSIIKSIGHHING